MAVWGLDVEQVRQLSTQLNQKATDIEGILSSLTSALNATQWEGPDANQFRNDWSGQHTSALRNVANALREAGSKAQQNAAAQEQTSTASPTGGGESARPLLNTGENPMAGMYGADVAQLRDLARTFDRNADRLDNDRMSVGNAIRISAWVGPVAVRFRAQWDSDHSRRVHEAALLLRDAAHKLRANADDQEKTSAVDGGQLGGVRRSTFPGGPILPPLLPGGFDRTWVYTFEDWLHDHPDASQELVAQMRQVWERRVVWSASPREMVDALAGTIAGVDALGALSEIFTWGVHAPKVLGPLGAIFDSAAAIDSAQNGDPVGAFLNGGSAVVGATGLPALEFAAFVSKGFVDWTLPYNVESQDETLDKGAETLFGKGVERSALSAEQTQKLAKRYDGLLGAANMISDRMNATADKIFPWNR